MQASSRPGPAPEDRPDGRPDDRPDEKPIEKPPGKPLGDPERQPPRVRTLRLPAVPRSRGVQVAFTLAAALVAALTLFLIRDVIGAFVLGGLLAFLILPVVDRLQRLLPRALAVLLTLAAVLAAVAFLISLLSPLVGEEVAQLQAQGPGLAGAAQSRLSRLEGRPLTVMGVRLNLSGLTSVLSTHANDVLLGQFGNAVGIGIAAVGTLLQLVLLVVVSFLMALDAPRIARLIRQLTPDDYRRDFEVIKRDVRSMLYAYMRGQLVVAACIGTLSGLAVSLLGVKFGLALGLVAGITALVPYLGPFLGAVPAVLVALAHSPQQALEVAIAYALISNVVLNLVYPKVVGDAVRLPPLLVIVSFIAGFSLAGILGMFVSVPIAATLRILYDHLQPRVFGPDPAR